MKRLNIFCFCALLLSSCSTLKEGIKVPIAGVEDYYLCFPEGDPDYNIMDVKERTNLLKEILLEIDTRKLNCEERFKNIKTVTEDFKEINQRDLDTKSGMCRTNRNGPCRYD
tara:strand:- start:881 stop:1216 length:336 start_codon:yes stop_codon:yes gene_type:complete